MTSRRLGRLAWRVPAGRWRRSLQVRVIATTLAASVVVIAVLGVLLLDQVAHGLLDAKHRSALAESEAGLSYAQTQLSQSDTSDPQAIDRLLETVTVALDARGNGIYVVGLLPTTPGTTGFYDRDNFDPAEIPVALRRTVVSQQVLASTYVTPRHIYQPGPELVVGAPLTAPNGDSYELYFAFPLSNEIATLSLVRGTLTFGGFALVALIAAVVALVTRQVVTPVRLAAQVADRLAAGRLEERMRVRGEDELARLATAFNAMAAALQRHIGELEELSRVQQRFTADVSHELRTPLTTIRMAADLLLEARVDFPPEVARSAELLHGELDRFESLLVDLLEVSRFDARVAVLEAEPVDVADLVLREVTKAELFAVRRGVQLDTSGVPRTPLVAEVDPRRVQRIVRNLLVNAIDYGDGRPVELTMAGDWDSVALRVRDHGVGLRPGEAVLVFSRFWRADPSRARQTGGTGLGLSIALEDARLHGGWLQAWGEPGRGAAFRLVLPRKVGAGLSASPLPLEPPVTPAPILGASG
ncbi:MAG: MtrAB system histidine kinase MtrB [Mycobacteriales bacterium]